MHALITVFILACVSPVGTKTDDTIGPRPEADADTDLSLIHISESTRPY